VSLPLVDPLGRIYVTPAGTPVRYSAGLGYTQDGRLCVTSTLNPLDTFQAGLRRDNEGRLVVGDGVLDSRPYFFNHGIPTDKRPASAGAVIRQMDTTPVASDPYVAGVRVGPRGGVYMTTAAIGAFATPAPLAFAPDPEIEYETAIHE